ncbi:acetate/propionate family kinase [Vibrio sp. S17_S38]|uniref:acetate/propionate family kinase n=1 Tax=Vibrio sp. S17_S38 TaxID=2720229 RepID=UPI0016804590|nr:acetate/propionate family kinase [Vibrio sp. S17_S38]MBD1572672.1 acetate/propionate family kinase [Vibrio sp. S17_S38]
MSNQYVLVINSGSSSLKFAVINSESGEAVLTGLGECFGLDDSRMNWKYQGQKQEVSIVGEENHHQLAISKLVDIVAEYNLTDAIVAVGHRIVHGGEKFTKTVQINEQILNDIEAVKELAPLHAPANVIGIKAALKAFPALPQFAVFDTAFHQTMPAKAYMGAIDKTLYDEYSIRRYGFHGTSHYFVSREAAKMLNKPVEECSFISVHLGNGASVCAIKNGESVDTSMGFTPLSGLMMGTRCGDLDPGIIEFLINKGWSPEKVFDTLNKKSGFLGVSGLTSDARGILEAMGEGHEGATLAFQVFTYRVAKYIGSYMVALDNLDGIIFTGGIGENALLIRREILKYLKIFGYKENEQADADARFGEEGIITTEDSPVAMVIPTNEEFVIAQESVALMK